METSRNDNALRMTSNRMVRKRSLVERTNHVIKVEKFVGFQLATQGPAMTKLPSSGTRIS